MELAALNDEWRRGLGIRDRHGLIVVAIEGGSPAAVAGIERGDIIKEVNRHPVNNPQEFYTEFARKERGQSLLFLIKKSGERSFCFCKRLDARKTPRIFLNFCCYLLAK